MKRKLIALDLALLGLCVLVAMRFRQEWQSARDREVRMLGLKITPEKYPRLASFPQVMSVAAMEYIDIANKMLLAKDRSPNEIPDPPKVEEPKPMPALPVAHGLMMFEPPSIIMSEKPGASQRSYHAGDDVGPFKLVSFDNAHVVLEWEGKTIEKKMEELVAKPSDATTGSAASIPTAGATPRAENPMAAPPSGPIGPGTDTGGGYRACAPGDTTPAGTVQNGVRKIVRQTPFGTSCSWVPVQ